MLNVWFCHGGVFDFLVFFGRYGEIVKRISGWVVKDN